MIDNFEAAGGRGEVNLVAADLGAEVAFAIVPSETVRPGGYGPVDDIGRKGGVAVGGLGQTSCQ